MQLLFLIVAALMLGAAIMVVTVRNIIHAALWLITALLAMGMLYLLLEAPFLAVVQVLIYVGAVSVLVLFAVMLTRHVTGGSAERQLYGNWWVGLLVAGALLGLILAPAILASDWVGAGEAATGAPVSSEATELAGPLEIGVAFMREYLLPFQVAAVLLLVALVGAIVIAFETPGQRGRVLTLAQEWALRQSIQQHEAAQVPSESSEKG